MMTGRIRWFNKAKDYGFIIPNEGEKGAPDVFFHRNEVEDMSAFPSGAWVAYDAIDAAKGPRATLVKPCKKRCEHERSAERERERKNVIPFGTD